MGMGGGQMSDLSQLGDLMGNLGNMGMNHQMRNQIFNNPMYMQMM